MGRFFLAKGNDAYGWEQSNRDTDMRCPWTLRQLIAAPILAACGFLVACSIGIPDTVAASLTGIGYLGWGAYTLHIAVKRERKSEHGGMPTDKRLVVSVRIYRLIAFIWAVCASAAIVVQPSKTQTGGDRILQWCFYILVIAILMPRFFRVR